MTNIVDMVMKEDPGSERKALIAAFVDAHFHRETGAPVCGGFQEVLSRLGQRDLNFGPLIRSLGDLTSEESTSAKESYYARLYSAHYPDGRRGDVREFPSEFDLGTNPFLQHLSAGERLVFQGLDPCRQQVTNPAIATTLAQAQLERWFDIPALGISTRELLQQAAEQGDSHAAYLIGTKRTLDGAWLEGREEARQRYLFHAFRAGNDHALEAIQEAKEDQARSEEYWEIVGVDEDRFQEVVFEWTEAKRAGLGAKGDKLLEAANQLLWTSMRLFTGERPQVSNIASLNDLVKQAREWIQAAGKTSASARHRLAMAFVASGEDGATRRINLLESAVRPEAGIEPFYPALVDLAEAYEKQGSTDKARVAFEEAIEKITQPEASLAVRMGDLALRLAGDESEDHAYRFYLSAQEKSPHAAFFAGLLALRAAITDKERELSHAHFQACVDHGTDADSGAARIRQCGNAALLLGWGSFDSEDWDEAAFLLVKLMHDVGYQESPFRKGDIVKLLEMNPEYEISKGYRETFASMDREEETGSDLSAQALMCINLNAGHYALGSYEPIGLLSTIASIATGRTAALNGLEPATNGHDDTVLTTFLRGQLNLARRDTRDGQSIALHHFEAAWRLIRERQQDFGGEGISRRAESLRWLEEKTFEGIKHSQPGVWRVDILDQVDGPATDFGNQLLAHALKHSIEPDLPADARATSISYSDRYINTPMRVALLGRWMSAMKGHLMAKGHWAADCVVWIHTMFESQKYDERRPAIDNNWSQSPNWRVNKDIRDRVIWSTLAAHGIAANLNVVGKWEVPHSRGLEVAFSDGSRWEVQLDEGLGFWASANDCDAATRGFDFGLSADAQGKLLHETHVKIERHNSRHSMPCYVTWRPGPRI